jgi:hypothetical protein
MAHRLHAARIQAAEGDDAGLQMRTGVLLIAREHHVSWVMKACTAAGHALHAHQAGHDADGDG